LQKNWANGVVQSEGLEKKQTKKKEKKIPKQSGLYINTEK
jgi:hypothetical protein